MESAGGKWGTEREEKAERANEDHSNICRGALAGDIDMGDDTENKPNYQQKVWPSTEKGWDQLKKARPTPLRDSYGKEFLHFLASSGSVHCMSLLCGPMLTPQSGRVLAEMRVNL